MKKIILNILLLSGLLLAATEENVYKDTYNQITPPMINDNNISMGIKSSISPVVTYLVDIDGTINVKIDLISDSNETNKMTVKELKEMTTSLKKDGRINKVLLDLEASTVNDFKENLLLKKELDFEKKKVQELSNINLMKLENKFEESENNLTETISLTYMQLILIIIASILFVNLSELFLVNMEKEIEKKNISKVNYITISLLKFSILALGIFIITKFL